MIKINKKIISGLLCFSVLTAGMFTLYGNADTSGAVKAVSDTIGDMDSGLVIARDKGIGYTIVCNNYSSGATDEYEAAKALQSAFSTLLGGSSPRISSNAMNSRTKEIVVGTGTAPEEAGYFTVDRSGLGESGFLIQTIGNRIVITGSTSDGTWNGIEYFVKNYLGYDARTNASPPSVRNIAVPADINYRSEGNDNIIPLRSVEADGTFGIMEYGDINYDGMFEHIASNGVNATPCYSKSTVINTIERKAKVKSAATFNTPDDLCDCADCMAAAEAEKTEMGAYFRAVKTIAERNPSLNIRILAMNRTFKAPVSYLGDNVEVLICDRKLCSAHAIDDKNCPVNKAFADELRSWKKVCGKVSVIDFTSDYYYYPVSFPNLYTIKKNVSFYASEGVYGVYLQFDTSLSDLEFSDLRKYLSECLLSDPDMSDSEYSELMDIGIKHYYGESSAKAVRRYIDLFGDTVAARGKCFDIYSEPDEILPIRKSRGSGADAYDLTFARSAYDIWNEAFPYNEILGKSTSLYSRYLQYRYMSSPVSHAKTQFSLWLGAVTDIQDRTEVINAVMAGK